MTMSDPIADMLTRIRNANTAKHDTVDVPASKMKLAIVQILLDEGYIKKYDILDEGSFKTIHITLKYGEDKNDKIISGIKREPKVLIGRAGIKIPFLEKKDELILKQISIDIKTNGYIPTKDFIGVDIDAVAKVRVLTQRDVTVNAKGEVVAGADANKRITTEMANAAMKNFLNMNEDQIRDALTDSLQGNMREIIGTQCLKELCNDRKTFGDEVQAKAQKDMNALGIWIESCNIQKIEDENILITALGQDNMLSLIHI